MIKKITFEELVDTAAEKSQSSKVFTRDFIREMANVIQMGLVRDGVVNISGFGIFRLQEVDSRKGRNPQTGEEITIPSHKKVLFKPEKSLRKIINKRYEHLEPQIIDESPKRTGQKEQDVAQENVGAAFFSEAMDSDLKKSANEPAEETGPPTGLEKEPEAVVTPHESPGRSMQESEKKKNKAIPIAAAIVIVLILILFIYNYDSDDAGPESELAESTPVEQIEQPEATIQTPDTEEPVEASSVEETAPVQQQPDQAQPEEVEHSINEGENLWQLAQRYYDDGYKWPLILLENRDRLNDPDFVPEGVVLNIPVVETNVTGDDSELKSRLAQGHLLAYNAYKNKDNASALNHLYVAYRYDETQVNASMATVDEQDYETIINYPGVVR